MTEPLTAEQFSEHVDSNFEMHYGQSQIAALKLLSVTDLNSTPRQVQFSLEFLAPLDAPLRQGLFRLNHEKLGQLDLFLVPVARDKEGLHYEAVFNRFVE
jgi:hypothetical protein